jgi:hypothetical protein
MAVYTLSKIFKQIKKNQLDIKLIDLLKLDFSESSINGIFEKNDIPTKYSGFNDFFLNGSDLSSTEKSLFFLTILKTLDREKQLILTTEILKKFPFILNSEENNELLTYFFKEKCLLPPFVKNKIPFAVNEKNPLLQDKNYIIDLIDTIIDDDWSKESLQQLFKAVELIQDENISYYLRTVINNKLFSNKKDIPYDWLDICLSSDLPLNDKKNHYINSLKEEVEKDLSTIQDYFTANEIVSYLLSQKKYTFNEKKALLSFPLSYAQVFQLVNKSHTQYNCVYKFEEDIVKFKLELIKQNIFDPDLKGKLLIKLLDSYGFNHNKDLLEEMTLSILPKFKQKLVNIAFKKESDGQIILFLVNNKIDFLIPENASDEKIKFYLKIPEIQEKYKDINFVKKNNIIALVDALDLNGTTNEELESQREIILTILPFLLEKVNFQTIEELKSTNNITLNKKIELFTEQLNNYYFTNGNKTFTSLNKISKFIFDDQHLLSTLVKQDYFIEFSKKMTNSVVYHSEMDMFLQNVVLKNLLTSQWTEPHYQLLEKIDFNVKKTIPFSSATKYETDFKLSTNDNYSVKKEKEQLNHFLELTKKNKDLLLCDEMIDIIERLKSGKATFEQALSTINQKKESILGEKSCL